MVRHLKEKVVLIGAGGHAKVIIDILRQSNKYEIIGLTDRNIVGETILNVPVIGFDSALKKIYDHGVKNAFVAIGDNKKRRELINYTQKIGYNLINAVSSKTYISSTVKLGKGIAIMPGVIINPDSTIGDNSIVNTGSTIDHDCFISKNVHIAPGCNLAGKVTLGEGVLMGIGCKCIPEISIGPWSILGAGSVIVQDIPAYSVAIGVPARIKNTIKWE